MDVRVGEGRDGKDDCWKRDVVTNGSYLHSNVGKAWGAGRAGTKPTIEFQESHGVEFN